MFCEVMEMDYEDYYRGNDSSEKEGKKHGACVQQVELNIETK